MSECLYLEVIVSSGTSATTTVIMKAQLAVTLAVFLFVSTVYAEQEKEAAKPKEKKPVEKAVWPGLYLPGPAFRAPVQLVPLHYQPLHYQPLHYQPLHYQQW